MPLRRHSSPSGSGNRNKVVDLSPKVRVLVSTRFHRSRRIRSCRLKTRIASFSFCFSVGTSTHSREIQWKASQDTLNRRR